MTTSALLDDDIEQAFPTDPATTADQDARLTCLRELHQHYLGYFYRRISDDYFGLG